MRHGVMVTFLLLAASSPVARALAEEPPPRFEGGVDLVYVTVAVVDKQGRPLTDLTRDDFVVKENGKLRPVSVFARADGPADERTAVDGCVLVDTSGSVSTMTEKITASALRVMERLPKIRRRCLLSFDNDVRVWRPEGETAALVRDIVAARTENGATALNTAIVTALENLGDSPGRALIVLISDGEDVGSRVTQADAIAALQRSRVAVYPITHAAPVSQSLSPGAGAGQRPLAGGNTGITSFGTGSRFAGPAYLAHLAEISGGRVLGPDDGGVDEALGRLEGEVAGQYVLGFAPANVFPGLHKLKLSVTRKDARVRSRTGFVLGAPASR
jgi:Ca-activated chloride channel family protein